MPPMSIVPTPMNGSAAASGASRAKAEAAAGPCRASSARSSVTVELHACRRFVARWVEIVVLATGIHDEEQPVVAEVRHHQVVENAAGFVGEQAVTLPLGLQPDACRLAPTVPARRRRRCRSASPGPCGRRRTGTACERQCRCSAITPPRQRAARSPFRSYCDRHGIAGEPDHARAQPAVPRVQRRGASAAWVSGRRAVRSRSRSTPKVRSSGRL